MLVLVGALIVASIETVWSGPASPYREEIVSEHNQDFRQGDEIGRFLLGSTVICCFAKDAVTLAQRFLLEQVSLWAKTWAKLTPVGQAAAKRLPPGISRQTQWPRKANTCERS